VKVVWTGPAVADRSAIREYIARDDPGAAVALDELISERCNMLLDQPNLGKKGRVEGTRELVIHKNYILVYDLSGDSVRILRVLHTALLWPKENPPSGT